MWAGSAQGTARRAKTAKLGPPCQQPARLALESTEVPGGVEGRAGLLQLERLQPRLPPRVTVASHKGMTWEQGRQAEVRPPKAGEAESMP